MSRKKRAEMYAGALICAYLRDEAGRKILYYEHLNYPKEYAYQFWAQTGKTEAQNRRKTLKSSALTDRI